ncbi:hypothetical protein ABLE91_17645 [Aquabacter sp. CN5-332]|uniref:hypothetical protein n=1 Tax=Aquabacter sp. CN5-332 TaxID=3156608 RepID=UPI0032B4F894
MGGGRRAVAPVNWSYRVSGLTLGAERPLPYLNAVDDTWAPDVRIAFAPVPAQPAAKTSGLFHIHAPDLVDLVVPDRLTIRISGGRQMTVAVAPDLEAGELQTLLFGPAFAVLLHQRGSPPLHAGAVRVGEGALAIAGHSGAGKSTTVRALVRRGCRLLCDDQLVVEAGTGMAHAGFPAMKLWGHAAAFFGEAVEAARRVRPGLDKFHLDAAEAFAPQAVPLRVICVLVPDPAAARPTAERLSSPQAVMALGGLCHYGQTADALGMRPAIFRWAAALAARVPVYVLRRPDDLAGIEEVADLVWTLARQHAPEAAETPA